MADVAFKQGLQSALNSIAQNKTGQEGSFYLTSDSHRLYVGLTDGSIAAVNEGVTTVTNVAALPTVTSGKDLTAGQFYYAATENVLCVYNGTSWVQINPDTDINSLTITATAASDIATVTTEVSDTKENTFADNFEIKGISGTKITVTPAVGSTPPQIQIAGDVYAVSTTTTPASVGVEGYNTAQIKLHSQNQSSVDTKVTLVGGDNVHIVGDAATGNIGVSSENTKINTVAFTPQAAGGFRLTVTDSDAVPHEGVIDPSIKIGKSATGDPTEQIHFTTDGVATLNIYTAAQVDTKIQEKLKALDALTFKGTLGTGGTLATAPTTNVSVGDLYKIVSQGTYGGVTCKTGDMLIAQGTENAATGYITGTITWVYVPSGDETDTTYVGRKIVHGMTVVQAGNEGNIISKLSVSTDAGNPIQLTDDGGTDQTVRDVKITHKTTAQTNTTGTAQTQSERGTMVIPIEEQTVDSFGHVTGTKKTNYTVVDTHNNLNAVKSEVAVAANTATVTIKASMKDGEEKQSSFTVSSNNLTITEAQNENITINLAWGSF